MEVEFETQKSVLHVSPNTVTRELKKRVSVAVSQPTGVKATESRAD